MKSMRTLWLVLGIGLASGCTGPKPLKLPKYSPDATADAAMADFDKNNDGKLNEQELQRCPALKNALSELDKDGDGAVSKAELETALNDFARLNVAQITARCVVTRGGAPLANAQVKFLPEKFHGESIKAASGKSDPQGNVELRTEGSPHPGLAFGFYRVEVSLLDEQGQETIPANFNATTTLGRHVTPQMRGVIEIPIP